MKESYDFWGIIVTDKSGSEVSGRISDDINMEQFQGNEGIEYVETDYDEVIGIGRYEVNNDGVIDLFNMNSSGSELNLAKAFEKSDIKKGNTQRAEADEDEVDEFFGHRIDSSEDIYHYGYDTEVNHIEGHMEPETANTDGVREIFFDVDGSILY